MSAPTSAPNPDQCAVFELRQYTLHPGRRDELIELFEREFIESQEREGMFLLGIFRDLDRDDRFVWLRGFRDMDERLAALTAFYSGPVWKQHRNAANATMIDSDDVLLLRPLEPVAIERSDGAEASTVSAMIAHVAAGDIRQEIAEVLVASCGDASRTIAFETLPAENTFPALPIREDANVVVVLSPGDVTPPPGVAHLRLGPTTRSLLR